MTLTKNRIPYLESIKIPYNLGKEEEEEAFPSFQGRRGIALQV